MICIVDGTTDPCWNLAAEEYLLTGLDEPVFRLWRNAPSVIIGRYQNALAEINTEYIQTHNIPVVRRLTGGGAVFHDLGNINYTFIDKKIPDEDTGAMFRRFTAPIIEALKGLGINASLQGRNDLVIEDRKFSGNAVCVHGGRVLQHGTLLFSASVADLSAALNTRPEKFTGKSVQSNRARVTNISEHLTGTLREMSAEDFLNYLQNRIADSNGCITRGYTQTETAGIDLLSESKYATWQWNFGNSPHYGLNRIRKFPSGLIEVSLDVSGGIIRSCSIRGDYFFTRPTEEVEQALTGLPHSYGSVLTALSALPLTDYFGPVPASELTSLFF